MSGSTGRPHPATESATADDPAVEPAREPDQSGPDELVDAIERPTAPAAQPSLIRVVVASLARAVVMTVAAMLLWAGLPMLLGWHTTTVLTGSMQPRLLVGDLAVSRPVAPTALKLQQVILFDDPDHHGRLRLHRLIGVDPEGRLVTKGDANPQQDSSPVDPAAVRGVATLRVPYIATPRVWVAEGRWPMVVGAGLALIAVLALTRLDRVRPPADGDRGDHDQHGGDQDDADHIGADQNESSPPSRRRRMLLVLGAPAAAAVIASSVITQATSYSAFGDTTSNSDNNLSAAPFYKCANAIANDAPRIWYRLDETSGTTAADSSGQGRPGTYRGGGFNLTATKACANDTGSAATFNGTTSYLSSNSAFTAPNVLTLETWFKTTSQRGGLLVGFGNAQTGSSTTADRQLYLTNTGQVSFSVLPSANSKITLTSQATARDGGWHHAAATLSSTGMALYLDGEPVGSTSAATSGASYTGYVRVGQDKLSTWTNAPTSTFLAATLDDVAVYNTALTASDIADHYNAAS